jgi:hypothetical protein
MFWFCVLTLWSGQSSWPFSWSIICGLLPSYPGPPTVDSVVKQVPFAILYTWPPDDGLQMSPKNVEEW